MTLELIKVNTNITISELSKMFCLKAMERIRRCNSRVLVGSLLNNPRLTKPIFAIINAGRWVMFIALVCVEIDCGAQSNSITNTSANSKSNMGVFSCVRGLCRTDFLKIEKSVSFLCYFNFLTKRQNLSATCETKWQFCENILMRLNSRNFAKTFLSKFSRKICV